MDRLKKQLDFIIEIDKLKGILRQSLVLDGARRENDTEHSWHMSMCALILKEYYKEEVDMLKVIKMILIHDIVEILAGDTPAYGTFSPEEKRENEMKAAEKTFGILPEDQKNEFMKLWLEFEYMETKDSKFANACDRFQGFIQNVTSDAHTWRKFHVTKSKLMNRMRPIFNFIPEVYYGYIQGYMKEYLDNGVVTDDRCVKLIACDLDGTFLDGTAASIKKNVPKINADVINRLSEEGVVFVPASGRDLPSIKDMLSVIKDIKYYSCFNGARIFKGDELIYSEKMDRDMCLDILKKAAELRLHYSGTAGYDVCFTKMDKEYFGEAERKDTKYIFHPNENFDNVEAFEFEKMVFFGDEERFRTLRTYVEEKYSDKVNIFGSGDNVMDIVSKKCSKGTSLRIIADDMGIATDEIMAFGDNENDLSMLTTVGYPVAMINGKDFVKELVKTHTEKGNEEGGVGLFLEKFFM